jgi:hypothetical protein
MAIMWMRSLLLMFAIGCAGVGDAGEPAVAAVAQHTTVPFHCLNHTSIHVVTCSGTISLFPITITIEDISILSDNDLTILSTDLDDLSNLDDGVLDHDKVLDHVEARVIRDLADVFGIVLTASEISVCTEISGGHFCV